MLLETDAEKEVICPWILSPRLDRLLLETRCDIVLAAPVSLVISILIIAVIVLLSGCLLISDLGS